MPKEHTGRSRRQMLSDITLAPAVARLPNARRPERRNVPAREALVGRIRREFEEMPGLSLTLPQSSRLFGLPSDVCSRILTRLIDERRLRLTGDGRYSLRVAAA